jgi:tetratricopeptide (TPR) repeat protein
MGLFPRARGATPSEPEESGLWVAEDGPEPEPEPEPEVSMEAIRAEGKRRKKKKAGEYAGTGEVVKKGKNKGKERVSREQMLLTRLEKQGDNYKNDGDTLVELAALYADKHAWAQAIHYYKLSLRALPESRDAIVPGLANAYFEYEMYEEAQFLYQDAVKKPAHVRMPRVWYHLGVIYERQLKWEIAEYCLRHALTLLPPLGRDVEIYCRLATCSNRLGNPKDAIQSYKSACTAAAKPDVGAQPWISEELVWFELALQYDATSEPQLAKRCYGKSLMNATNPECWQALGKRYTEIKEGTRAVSALNKAVELESENPLLWWSLAEAYCCLNEKEKCVDGIRKVGIKLEKLVGDVKRREDDMRKRAHLHFLSPLHRRSQLLSRHTRTLLASRLALLCRSAC